MNKIIFFITMTIILSNNQLVAVENKENIYLITSGDQKKIPREYYSFLEGVSHDLTYNELVEESWSSKMQTPLK